MANKPVGKIVWENDGWQLWKGIDKGYEIFTLKGTKNGIKRKVYSVWTSPYIVRSSFEKE